MGLGMGRREGGKREWKRGREMQRFALFSCSTMHSNLDPTTEHRSRKTSASSPHRSLLIFKTTHPLSPGLKLASSIRSDQRRRKTNPLKPNRKPSTIIQHRYIYITISLPLHFTPLLSIRLSHFLFPPNPTRRVTFPCPIRTCTNPCR